MKIETAFPVLFLLQKMNLFNLLFHSILAVSIFRVPSPIARVVLPLFSHPLPAVPKQLGQDLSHMVILVHGLNTDHTSMAVLKNALQRHNSNFLIIESIANTHNTHAGIQVGIERLTEEVKAHLRINPQVTKFSVIAHSLGGIYSRGMIKEIANDKEFANRLQFKKFVAFASPMLASLQWRMDKYFGRKGATTFAKVFNGQTGVDLTLLDSKDFKNSRLVSLLSNEHLDALGKFESRVLISNLRNDAAVSRATSALEPGKIHPDVQPGVLLSKHSIEKGHIDPDFFKTLLKRKFHIKPTDKEIQHFIAYPLHRLGWDIYDADIHSFGSAHVAIVDRFQASLRGRKIVENVIKDNFASLE